MAKKPPLYTDKHRQAELAKIHIAKKQLGLDDDTYKSLLNGMFNVSSSKDLTPKGRADLLEYFKKQGFVAKKRVGRPNNLDVKPMLQKVEALLSELGLPWDYALAMAKHMYKKQRLEFCHEEELRGIIAALYKYKQKQESKYADAIDD